jgi:hypothetical protein
MIQIPPPIATTTIAPVSFSVPAEITAQLLNMLLQGLAKTGATLHELPEGTVISALNILIPPAGPLAGQAQVRVSYAQKPRETQPAE